MADMLSDVMFNIFNIFNNVTHMININRQRSFPHNFVKRLMAAAYTYISTPAMVSLVRFSTRLSFWYCPYCKTKSGLIINIVSLTELCSCSFLMHLTN